METVRRTPRQFADTVSAQIAINGSFYSSQTFNGVPWANNLGLTVSNGDKYSPWELPSSPNFDDALNISQANQAAIVKIASSIPTGFETNPPVTLFNTMTGSHRIVTDGVNVAPPPGTDNLTLVHPRTAVGVTLRNQLLLMTVDGRQSGFSEGVNLVELANLMLGHGARDAINLDGGGSTQMVMNYYDDALATRVVNSPSEAERSVGASLAVFARRSGDFNGDGAVNAADYVVWRKNGLRFGYEAWRANFGLPNGAGGSAAIQSLPEPPSVALVVVAACACFADVTRRRRGRDHNSCGAAC
jgi:exopolysaccharide biosynthesis protein